MKKIYFIFIILLFFVCGCKANDSNKDDMNTNVDTDDDVLTNNILVAYFSATNNTKRLAELISKEVGGDLFEIEPVIKYTSSDLDYNNNNSRANREQNDPNARPEIKNMISDFDKYDTIIIATALWWGESPKIIATFIESYNFDNKTIIPVCTSSSSGISGVEKSMKEYCKDNAKFLDGKRFSSNFNETDVIEWINKLDLKR